MYQWRQLTAEERFEILGSRARRGWPAHAPPRWRVDRGCFHLTAACYEHAAIIGADSGRMDEFTRLLLETCATAGTTLHAWCVLPNHYHLVADVMHLQLLTRTVGRLHGRCAFQWNRADATPGRTTFHGLADRALRSEAHFWATLNYVHHNPVRHGYVSEPAAWPWSSLHEFTRHVGSAEARRIWSSYPVLDYGKLWDPPEA